MSEQLTLEALTPKTEVVFWIGIDVAKQTFDAAIHPPLEPGARPDLSSLPVRSFNRTQAGINKLLAWIDDQIDNAGLDPDPFEPKVRVLMEATGKYSLELAAWLIAARPQVQPAIVNPGFIAAHGKSLGARNKTDRADARIIARFGAERSPEPYQPLTPARTELRDLVRERLTVVGLLVALRARIAEKTSAKQVTKSWARQLKALETSRDELEAAIEALLKSSLEFKADLKLLTSIPGIGLITAATILAEIGDLRAFKRARALSAFVGLSARQWRSGTSINGRTRMSKRGNARVRAALYMPAVAIIRGDSALSRYYHALLA